MQGSDSTVAAIAEDSVKQEEGLDMEGEGLEGLGMHSGPELEAKSEEVESLAPASGAS